MKLQLKELVREDVKSNLGILSDTTYKFFLHGFLMTSSIYSIVLKRWIPVVFSFVGKEDENHMKEHFRFLMESLREVIPAPQFENALDSVVDFSSAEHNAFVQAYVDLMMSPRLILEPDMSEAVRTINKEELAAKAESHLKGCEQHYRYEKIAITFPNI
jgi:hypothetical protein